MRWLAVFAVVLFFALPVCGTPAVDKCSYYSDDFALAKSSADPLYIDMPDSVGLLDTAKIKIYVNDPAVKRDAKVIMFSSASYTAYTTSGAVKDIGSGYLRSVVPYSGESSVEIGIRNLDEFGDPVDVMFSFFTVKPYPEGAEYEAYSKGNGVQSSPWYRWSCGDESNPIVCGGKASCKVCYKEVGAVRTQYMTYSMKAKATPPGGVSFTPAPENERITYQAYSFANNDNKATYNLPGQKPWTVPCPVYYNIAVGKYSGWQSMKDLASLKESKKRDGFKVSEGSAPGGMTSGSAVEFLSGDDASCRSQCENPRSMSFSIEYYAEMNPPGSGIMRVTASREACIVPAALKSEIEKVRADVKSFMSSYTLEGGSPKPLTPIVCYYPKRNVTVPEEPAEVAISGRLTDGHNHPLPYAKVDLSAGGKKYNTVADEAGNYEFKKVKGIEPNAEKPPKIWVMVTLSYVRDGKNYFDVNHKSPITNQWYAYFVRKGVELKSDGDLRQDVDFNINPNGYTHSLNVGDVEWESADWISYASDLAGIYYYMSDAVDFSLTILDAKVDYKLPVDVWVGDPSMGKTRYTPGNSDIIIADFDDTYEDTDRPKNREYHEFSHHIMYSEYGAWPEGKSMPGDKNHDGFLNPSTGDSYVEGFAEFMAMTMSEYTDDPDVPKPPSKYAALGDYEDNYKTWGHRGRDEETAIAGALWDLHDKENEAGDSVTLSLQEMWPVLKVKRKDFYEYYKAFKQAFPSKAADIDKIMVMHGIFADNQTGNKKRDTFEPFRDANNNNAFDATEYYVDYGVQKNVSEIKYDAGETIGKATNYGRPARSKAGLIPDAFIKVTDDKVRFYTVKVHYINPSRADGEYTTESLEGKIYLAPLPEDVDATITVKPKTEDYTAGKTYTITSGQYTEKLYASEGKGFADTFDFK
ncbi:MAG: carboxypeptidase-like regulatory domain-containing protein, partial [Candidatus Altiarchaeota archaeon]|nr:carboxypeptidase-like regulatory domain-containing protein [Candidatus Altiarchaeota archaeon]